MNYEVFVVTSYPYSATSTSAASPIESVFAADSSGKFITSTSNRIEMPTILPIVDTKVGVCGRVGCDCADTHKMRAASADYEILKTIYYSKRSSTSNGVVIVKTTTVSVSSTGDDLSTILSSTESLSGGGMHLFYFAKWLDRTSQYENLSTLSGGGKIVRTWNPHGIQAIAITPTGLETIFKYYPSDTNPVVTRPLSLVINNMIQSGTLYAATTTPSLLQYDSTLVDIQTSSTNSDVVYSYLKTCE